MPATDWVCGPLVGRRTRADGLLQSESSDFAGLEHMPVEASHAPASWQSSIGVQMTAVPEQTPFWHVSFVTQRFPVLQGVPLSAFGLEHAPVAGSQVPAL
jgi:hypothetical protein